MHQFQAAFEDLGEASGIAAATVVFDARTNAQRVVTDQVRGRWVRNRMTMVCCPQSLTARQWIGPECAPIGLQPKPVLLFSAAFTCDSFFPRLGVRLTRVRPNFVAMLAARFGRWPGPRPKTYSLTSIFLFSALLSRFAPLTAPALCKSPGTLTMRKLRPSDPS